MKCYCGSICKVANAVRLSHFILTFFVFYVMLTNQHSDLHHAWAKRNAYFISLVTLLSISLFLYLIASLINPGFLPKSDLPLPSLKAPTKSQSAPSFPEKPPTDHSVAVDSSSVELSLDTDCDSSSNLVVPSSPVTNMTGRYCRVCHHPQPMRSKHCYQCGYCVRRFDHHCPWLGNCVGERNHRFFWMFLTCETALLIWGVCIAWSAISIKGGTLEWLRSNILVFFCLSVLFIAAIIVGLLLLYHSYLMLSGQTTWEQASRHRIIYLKDLQELSNPFDEGCCYNIARFVCSGLRDWEQVYISRTKAYRTKNSA